MLHDTVPSRRSMLTALVLGLPCIRSITSFFNKETIPPRPPCDPAPPLHLKPFTAGQPLTAGDLNKLNDAVLEITARMTDYRILETNGHGALVEIDYEMIDEDGTPISQHTDTSTVRLI